MNKFLTIMLYVLGGIIILLFIGKLLVRDEVPTPEDQTQEEVVSEDAETPTSEENTIEEITPASE